ncbi:MAG: UDP-2,3-diacylglucosamine diphosphatase [Chlorobiales bacterium]|nr:UDP-2,3-diacylglucosamine diphosphatase [Chlorobiales bacterium]
MAKTYFVSDVHFGLQEKSQEDAKLELMLTLLSQVGQDGGRLYMVGDILDYWMEYRHVVPKGYVRFFSALDSLVRRGVQVAYLAGNHDFYLGKYFDDELGIKTHYGEIEVLLGKKKFYIAHGDGIGNGDIGYKLFRKLIRNNTNLRLFRWIHPDFGVGLMSYLSRLSRKHTYDPVDFGERERLIVFANELAEKINFDYFVCGHRHVPKLHRLKNRKSFYVNLGTWIGDEPTYAVFDGERIQIRNAKTSTIIAEEQENCELASVKVDEVREDGNQL